MFNKVVCRCGVVGEGVAFHAPLGRQPKILGDQNKKTDTVDGVEPVSTAPLPRLLQIFTRRSDHCHSR